MLRSEIVEVVSERAVFPMPDGQAAPTVAGDRFTERRSGIAHSIAVQTACAWTTVLLDAMDRDHPESAIAAATIIHDVATWNELDAGEDTISGLDRPILTRTGRIRVLDDALSELRQFDVDDDATRLADLELGQAVADVMAAEGVDLGCAP